MLNRISEYVSERLTALRVWKEQRKISNAAGFCSLTISATEIFLVYAAKKDNHIALQLCDKIPLPKSGNIVSVLSEIVDKYQLKNIPTLWILDPKDYQLIPMEALPVPADEFQSAIRWKVKSSLSFDLEDALLDKFDMPVQKSINAPKMITVVAARQSYVQKISNQIKESGLNLNVIDIPELSLRNITALFELNESATALIYLSQKTSQLIITRQSELYFSRRIDFDVTQLQADAATEQRLLEKLALEVQRSFDYFHTQWRSQVPERVFLVSPEANSLNLNAVLSQYLGQQVISLPMSEVIGNQSGVQLEHKPEFLPMIGGLLREEMSYASAN